MRRFWCVFILVFTIVPATQAQNKFWACPSNFEGQTLHVYNWSTYIAEDTISNFEQLCGVDIIYDTYGGNEEMLEVLASNQEQTGKPGYDVIVPSDYVIYALAPEQQLHRLNLKNIPNFANLISTLTNPLYDPGNMYTVPYQWGTVGIGYNQTATGEAITSWQQFFDYPGRVVWLDAGHEMISIALKTLGYNPNSSDPAEVAAAKQFLLDHSQNVVAIAADNGQDLLANGEADLVIEFSGDIFQVIGNCACEDFVYTIPQEGTVAWVDNLAIPAGAENPRLAEVFIDYILERQVSADISNYTAYASPNQAAIDAGLIDEPYLSNPGIYPPDEVMTNLFFLQSSPELDTLYSTTWDDIKAQIGQ